MSNLFSRFNSLISRPTSLPHSDSTQPGEANSDALGSCRILFRRRGQERENPVVARLAVGSRLEGDRQANSSS